MRRSVAITWHASFLVVSAALYFFFVIPRWYELTGEISHTVGTVARIACGVLVALCALPVLLTLQRTRRPECGTPQLALSLRSASVVLHLLGGSIIAGVAISEIWLTLDRSGQWLFGLYGAAAGVVLLAALAFYLAFVAELPPPPSAPPAPIKVAEIPSPTGDEADDATGTDETDDAAAVTETTADTDEPTDSAGEAAAEGIEATETGKLRNRRSGKGLLGRSNGGA